MSSKNIWNVVGGAMKKRVASWILPTFFPIVFPNSEKNFIMPSAVRSSFKTGLQVFSLEINNKDSRISFDKKLVLTFHTGDHFFLNWTLIFFIQIVTDDIHILSLGSSMDRSNKKLANWANSVGNLSPAMGARIPRNQVGIGLSYRPASLCSLATQFQTRFLESIPRPISGLKGTVSWDGFQ